MYSRYPDYKPFDPMENLLRREESRRSGHGGSDRRHESSDRAHDRRSGGYLEPVREEKREKPGFLGGLLKNFKLDLDSGDLLLLLIILFLSMEGDDDEILIILALVLFMGM